MRYSIVSMALLALAVGSARGAITDNLEVYFPLDESSGTTASDGSGNGRDGVLVNRGGSDQNAPNVTPADPDPAHSPWVSGRFGNAFAPAGAPDQDGDAAPQFQGGPAYFAGQPYWMLGANLTNGATTGGVPSNIQSNAFTYSFHVQMPYNATHSKDTTAGSNGSETVRGGQVLHDAQDVNNDGLGLSSADTNFWNINSGGFTQHVGGNRWSFFEVNEGNGDSLFHHYRGGAVGLNTDTTPGVFDVAGPGVLVDGSWHHVALVQDFTIGPGGGDGGIQDAFLYVDGNLVNWQTTQGSTAADAVIGLITLGAQPNTRGGEAARLYFDDYAVWSRALDETEIRSLSQSSLRTLIPEPTTGLLGLLGTLAIGGRRRRS